MLKIIIPRRRLDWPAPAPARCVHARAVANQWYAHLSAPQTHACAAHRPLRPPNKTPRPQSLGVFSAVWSTSCNGVAPAEAPADRRSASLLLPCCFCPRPVRALEAWGTHTHARMPVVSWSIRVVTFRGLADLGTDLCKSRRRSFFPTNGHSCTYTQRKQQSAPTTAAQDDAEQLLVRCGISAPCDLKRAACFCLA